MYPRKPEFRPHELLWLKWDRCTAVHDLSDQAFEATKGIVELLGPVQGHVVQTRSQSEFFRITCTLLHHVYDFMPPLQPSVYTVVGLHWLSKLLVSCWLPSFRGRTAAHLYSALWPCRGPCFLFCLTGLALACSLSSLLLFIVFLQRPSQPFLKHDSGSTFPSTSRSFLPLPSLGESCC